MQIRKGEKIPKLTPDMKLRWNYDRHVSRIDFKIRSHAKFNTVDDAKEFEERERDIAKNMGLRGTHGGPRQRRSARRSVSTSNSITVDYGDTGIDAVAALGSYLAANEAGR